MPGTYRDCLLHGARPWRRGVPAEWPAEMHVSNRLNQDGTMLSPGVGADVCGVRPASIRIEDWGRGLG
jgi:hypothetical protein